MSNPNETMLSSTMVSVLAPHWSGRIRRSKRYEGPGDSESQGAFQDMTNISGNPRGLERSLTAGALTQQRAAFMGVRRNTVDWSSNSDSARLDRDPKRKAIQTVPLEVNSGRMDNRNLNPGALSPVATNRSLHLSSSLVNLKEQPKTPQSRSQGVHTALSSKPTTSSLLLSLRRMNSSGRNSNIASSFSEESKTSRDQQGHLLTAPHSQNNNDKERAKSFSAASAGPVMSPHNMSEPNVFSASLLKKDTVDKPSVQQPQACSKHVSLTGAPSVRQQNCSGLDKTPHIYPEKSLSSLRHSPYDPSALLKSHALPQRTTLTTTSWWKQVTQESISPLTPNSPPNIKAQETTPSFDLSMPVPANNRFRSQIPQNADHNNKDESVCTGNMKLMKETQGGTLSLKQRNDWDSPVQTIDRLSKQYGSSMNNREPQNPHIVDSVTSRFKISGDVAQTTLSQPKDFCKKAVSNGLSTVTAAESHPTLQNISPATPTHSSSKYTGNQCPSKTNMGLKSAHIYSDMHPKHSFSSSFSLNDQTSTSKTTAPITKPTPLFFHSHQLSSKANIHTPSSQMSKFTHTTNATPLGFERSYASFPKPLPSKSVSSLIHTVGPASKTTYSPVPTASVNSSSTGSRPTITTVPSLSLLTPPATPVFSTSPTTTTPSSFPTPPATPVNKSPSCLKSSSPKERTMFLDSPDGDSKSRSEGKKVRRVTWDDSVDIQSPSEPITAEKPDSVNPVSPSPLSASSCPRNVRAPSIFNFLRSSSETTNTAPLCPAAPKTTSIQVEKGCKFRSMSSDCADSISKEEGWKREPGERMISDPIRQDLTANQRERKPCFESDSVQCHSSTSLSLPPDFSSGYRLRYSSPPYSTLMSSRSTQEEPKTKTIRSSLFKQTSQSTYPSELSLRPNPSPPSEFPLSTPQTLSLPPQNQTPPSHQTSKFLVSETDSPKNHSTVIASVHQSGQVLLVNNRVDVSSACSQGGKVDNSSTCVTETLVYSIKTKANTAIPVPKDTTPKPEKHTANTEENRLGQQSHTSEIKEVSDEPRSYSNQSSSSAGSQSHGDESCNKVMKDSLLSRSRFFSVEGNNEQSPKRSRFALKKSVSTPNSSLSRSDSEKSSKGNKKMDQVLNKLRQTFSPRRSDDDLLFPWKSRRSSQTPSVSGSSDVSTVSDVPSDSTKMLEEQTQKGKLLVKDKVKVGEDQNKYIIVPPPGGDKFSVWTEKTTPDTDQDAKNNCPGHKSESGGPVHATESSPTLYQCDLYKDNKTDNKSSNQYPTSRDPSPSRIPNPSGGYPTQLRKSTSSPKSPFSPFSSLAPISPFPSPEVTDDNVFYSPKLQRRRDSSSPCEPGEGLSLGTCRSRASTAPPTGGMGQDMEHSPTSYADLKYGIVPGRSFSVSSVLSSRPSGPGRISTGARVMSVGDLPKSSLTRACYSEDWDETDWFTGNNGQPSNESGFPCSSGKIRSRSLPRSLTKCLANWNSDVFDPHLAPTPASKSDAHCSSNVNICHFDWDAEGPPTPPPTPPLSPVSRRMSTAPSKSSPTFPSPPGAPQSLESQPSRGHLPSRGYVSSLSTFEESSDSCSDTTTDDEYYLEAGDGDDKETEL